MGRKSTIEGLPDYIREKLDKLLLDKRVTIAGATDYLNGWLEQHGVLEVMPDGTVKQDAPKTVSKSAVGRYSQTFAELTADIAETDHLAALMLKELNITNQSNVAQATAETLRVMLMHFIPILRKSMQAEELSIKEMKVITGMMKDLTVGHERLENSATINEKRQLAIELAAEQKANQKAAKNVEKAAKAAGVSKETIEQIQRDVLGMA
ncbi:MAG: DUF3486 family protein [Methylobacter sp.]|nr:MAG: DUF3486 family protein [Methylobacter sp.]